MLLAQSVSTNTTHIWRCDTPPEVHYSISCPSKKEARYRSGYRKLRYPFHNYCDGGGDCWCGGGGGGDGDGGGGSYSDGDDDDGDASSV